MRTLFQLLLRVGGTCLGAFTSFCHILLWVILSATLLALASVYLRREIEVPDFVLRRIEAQLATAHLSARFGSTTINPAGNLVLEALELRAASLTEPLLTCRAAHIKLSPWALLIGKLELDEIRIADARIDCPALVSPTGLPQPIFRNAHLLLRNRGNAWSLESADFFIGKLFVTASGNWELQAKETQTAAPKDILPAYLRYAREIATHLPELERLEGPRLQLHISILRDGQVDLRANLLASALTVQPFLRAKNISLALSAQKSSGEKAAFQVDLGAEKLSVLESSRAANVATRLTGSFDVDAQRVSGLALKLSSGSIDSSLHDLSLPALNASLVFGDGFKTLSGTVALDTLLVQVTADLAVQTAALDFDLDLLPSHLAEGLRRATTPKNQRILSTFSFKDPVRAFGKLALLPGWKLGPVSAHFGVGRCKTYGVSITNVSSDLELDGSFLAARNVTMRSNGSIATGSYTMDTRTLEHRFLLTGSIFPSDISPWFTAWWDVFWSDFDFLGNRATANLDIKGRWGAPEKGIVTGRINAGPIKVRDVPFDRVRARIFTRPQHVDISWFDASRGTARISGQFVRHDFPITFDPMWLTFDVRSNLSLKENVALIGQGEDVIAPFDFEKSPEIDASGHIGWTSRGEAREDVRAVVSSTGVLRYNAFPVENLFTEFQMKSGTIELQRIDAVLGSGVLQGQATITGKDAERRLRFKGSLKNADFPRVIKTWSDYRAAQELVPDAKPAPSPITKGRLTLALSAEGPSDSISTLRGSGSATITGADLATIKLLGPLSSLLKGTPLGFTALDLSEAQAEFALENEWLRFSQLRMSGPSALLKGKGSYNMSTSDVDFRVSLHPFRKNENAVANIVGFMLDPLASVLEVKLKGSIEKPDWSFVVGPTNLLRTLGGNNNPDVPAPEPEPQAQP